jgi:hypothetical protein
MFGRFPLQRKCKPKCSVVIGESCCVLCSFLAAMVVVDEDDKKLICFAQTLCIRWRGDTADVINSGRADPSHCLGGLNDDPVPGRHIQTRVRASDGGV